MAFTEDELERIYDRTDGRCHICGKKCAFTNRGVIGARGAWHVDHSVPVAQGGTSHGNNLYVACIGCNTSKQDSSTRSHRALHERTRAPLSREKRDEVRARNTFFGGTAGALVGLAVAGPVGGFVGLVLGGAAGNEADTD